MLVTNFGRSVPFEIYLGSLTRLSLQGAIAKLLGQAGQWQLTDVFSTTSLSQNILGTNLGQTWN